MDHNFFVYQRRSLTPLLQWGMGSSVLGTALTLLPNDYWRQFGTQAFTWGMIDTVLAFAGRRSALLRAEESFAGDISEVQERTHAEHFYRILMLNAGLDVIYIVAGMTLAQRYAESPRRRGLGHGVAVQGAFLLLFDGLLARDVAARWL